MREVKFRAWDSASRSMLTTFDGPYKILVNDEDGCFFCGGYMKNGDWNEPYLMQFTGLMDKNGKEIYEGDIISYPSGTIQLDANGDTIWNGKRYSQSPNRVNEVVFEQSAFCVKNGGVIGYSTNLGSDSIEVIGNIYQNPELLGKEVTHA